jgi:tetratricopeptide (TPR) repeat protein
MAVVFSQQGDAEGARKMFARALPIFREISDKNSYAITLINIAGMMKDEGDLNGANKTYDQALIAYGAQVSLMQMASCA